MKWPTVFILIAAVALLAACATQIPSAVNDAPGFFLGFIHGFTATASLVGSIVLNVRIYAVPNSGFMYDFGFVTGFASSILALTLAIMARVGGMLS